MDAHVPQDNSGGVLNNSNYSFYEIDESDQETVGDVPKEPKDVAGSSHQITLHAS